jgi:ubiquinone/menaquinone biosynthesis C-methylase UbiE
MARTKKQVRTTYDRIAESYAAARERPWPEVLDFITGLPAGGFVLDVGCGHGRHARPLALTGQSVVGIDISRNLLSIGKRAASSSPSFHAIDWLLAEATTLPVADATFDAALCIAVLHHLPTRRDRLLALTEMRRVLRPGSPALIIESGLEGESFFRGSGNIFALARTHG